MNQTQQFMVRIILVLGISLLAACGPAPGNTADSTPPGFVQVMVKLEKPGDPNSRGDFDITTQDVTKNAIPSGLVIHIQATAGDSESGVSSVTMETRQVFDKGTNAEVPSNLTWKCGNGHSSSGQIVPVLQAGAMPFTLSAPPSPAPKLWQVDAVADPIAATGCTIDPSAGVGPISVEGFVRLKVTNGAGQSTTSKTFIFDYADVGK